MEGFTAGETLKLMTMRRSKKRDLAIRRLGYSVARMARLKGANAPAEIIERERDLMARRVEILRDMIGGK